MRFITKSCFFMMKCITICVFSAITFLGCSGADEIEFTGSPRVEETKEKVESIKTSITTTTFVPPSTSFTPSTGPYGIPLDDNGELSSALADCVGNSYVFFEFFRVSNEFTSEALSSESVSQAQAFHEVGEFYRNLRSTWDEKFPGMTTFGLSCGRSYPELFESMVSSFIDMADACSLVNNTSTYETDEECVFMIYEVMDEMMRGSNRLVALEEWLMEH
jgi:hypothetical protein